MSQGANTDGVSPVGGGVDESPTLHTNVVVSGTNHSTGVDNLNETTSPIVSENGVESPEHLKISEELKSQ